MSRQTFYIASGCVAAVKVLLDAFQPQLHLSAAQSDAIVDAMGMILMAFGHMAFNYTPSGSPIKSLIPDDKSEKPLPPVA